MSIVPAQYLNRTNTGIAAPSSIQGQANTAANMPIPPQSSAPGAMVGQAAPSDPYNPYLTGALRGGGGHTGPGGMNTAAIMKPAGSYLIAPPGTSQSSNPSAPGPTMQGTPAQQQANPGGGSYEPNYWQQQAMAGGPPPAAASPQGAAPAAPPQMAPTTPIPGAPHPQQMDPGALQQQMQTAAALRGPSTL